MADLNICGHTFADYPDCCRIERANEVFAESTCSCGATGDQCDEQFSLTGSTCCSGCEHDRPEGWS